MAFDNLIRNAVTLADSLTSSLQSTVQHFARTGQDHAGNPTYAAAVSVPAIVEQKFEQRILTGGREVSTRAKVTILRPSTIVAGDKLVLPDGSTSPIVDVQSITDPDTSSGYFLEVFLGVDRTVS